MGSDTATDTIDVSDVDVISLTVPAAERFVRLVRIGAASLARRRGFSVRAIDDLRVAVDEAFVLLLGETDHDGAVDISFEVDDHELSITITQRFDDGMISVPTDAIVRFDTAITEIVDRYEADPERGVIQFTKRA